MAKRWDRPSYMQCISDDRILWNCCVPTTAHGEILYSVLCNFIDIQVQCMLLAKFVCRISNPFFA